MDSETVWTRIVRHSSEVFRQLRRKPFTYGARGRTIYLHGTNRMISRAAIEKALDRVPLSSTTEVQDLSAPSYVCGILDDSRIRRSDR